MASWYVVLLGGSKHPLLANNILVIMDSPIALLVVGFLVYRGWWYKCALQSNVSSPCLQWKGVLLFIEVRLLLSTRSKTYRMNSWIKTQFHWWIRKLILIETRLKSLPVISREHFRQTRTNYFFKHLSQFTLIAAPRSVFGVTTKTTTTTAGRLINWRLYIGSFKKWLFRGNFFWQSLK
jgi:hypothetical protein